jgi:hypothetical protein
MDKTSPYWIGLFKEADTWKWADGSPLDYENWKKEGPNGWKGTLTPIEWCGSFVKDKRWRDVDCTTKQKFICKRLPST